MNKREIDLATMSVEDMENVLSVLDQTALNASNSIWDGFQTVGGDYVIHENCDKDNDEQGKRIITCEKQKDLEFIIAAQPITVQILVKIAREWIQIKRGQNLSTTSRLDSVE